MKRMNRKKVSLAVRQAISAGVVFGLAAPMVHAQQAATPPVQTLEKVEVTGSRITSATFESASPINTITAQDIAITGLQSTANIINQLPQAFADQGGNISNGADGTSTVNLRGLGASRTLVLIDGKRVPAGSPTQYATNLNNIPAPLIKRVEVLTGGASAVYGSDAVAGVVNFIMNDSFEGVQIQYNGSTYQHTQNGTYTADLAARQAVNPGQFQVPGDFWGEGTVQNYNILMGSNFANGKGNATIFFQYQNTGAILQNKYNYSACSLGTNARRSTVSCAAARRRPPRAGSPMGTPARAPRSSMPPAMSGSSPRRWTSSTSVRTTTISVRKRITRPTCSRTTTCSPATTRSGCPASASTPSSTSPTPPPSRILHRAASSTACNPRCTPRTRCCRTPSRTISASRRATLSRIR